MSGQESIDELPSFANFVMSDSKPHKSRRKLQNRGKYLVLIGLCVCISGVESLPGNSKTTEFVSKEGLDYAHKVLGKSMNKNKQGRNTLEHCPLS